MLHSFYRTFVRGFTLVFYGLIRGAAILVPQPRTFGEGPFDVLITGTFYSDQWLITHLAPLALSDKTGRVVMVASRPIPEIAGVTGRYPPAIVLSVLGEVGGRTLWYFLLGLFGRYHIYGGFHLLLNGMVAALLARLRRGRSLYICGGGPREVLGGGFETENRIYGRLAESDAYIESLLLKIVGNIDFTVCMGTSAVDFFRQAHVDTRLSIIPGGFSPAEFYPGESPTEFDFILVGRLSGVKRIDRFLASIARAKERYPTVTAVIVGDGPDRAGLEQQAQSRGVGNCVTFAGWQQNVADWLRKSRVFVLTSDSEGLSQALLQGLMCGLPAVVSNVGDLGDCISHGSNGFLVDTLSVEAFADYFVQLLDDPALYDQMRANALQSSAKYDFPRVAQTWNQVLTLE